jgi:hypothetical protein
VFLGNNGIDESMEEIVVTGRREDEPNFNVRNAILRGASAPYQDGTLDPDLRGSLMMEDDIGYDEAYNYAQEMQNLNPEASYRGQTLDQMILAGKNARNKMINTGKKFGKDIYNTAAMASTGIGNIPIAGVAYKNAIAKSNPAAFLAGTVLAPNVMSDFGFAEGGPVEDKEAQRQIDRVMMAVNRLMEMGVSEEEARAVVQRHLELGPYPEQLPGKVGPDEFMRRQRERRKSDPSRPQTLPGPNPFNRDYSNDDSMRLLNDEMFITEDGLDLRESDGTSLNNFDEMNYKANGGQVRRRVPDMYFGRYNMGGAVAPGQVSKTPMPAGNPMLKQITNTDPRYYSAPPNPMGNLVGGISNLANNQKKTNKLLGGNNQNNNAMNQNLKISYNPNPTNKDQRLVFSNVLESTRPV